MLKGVKAMKIIGISLYRLLGTIWIVSCAFVVFTIDIALLPKVTQYLQYFHENYVPDGRFSAFANDIVYNYGGIWWLLSGIILMGIIIGLAVRFSTLPALRKSLPPKHSLNNPDGDGVDSPERPQPDGQHEEPLQKLESPLEKPEVKHHQ